MQFGDAKGFDHAFLIDAHQGLVDAGRARDHAPDGQPAQELGIAEVGDKHPVRLVRIVGRGRNLGQDGLEKGRQVGPFAVEFALGDTFAADGVQDRKFELLLGGVEINKEVVNLI